MVHDMSMHDVAMVRDGALWFITVRANYACYTRRRRIERHRYHRVSRTVVRYGARVAATRPHTREYSEEARIRLGLAVQRGREAAGHQWRPSFATEANISVRSLVKLEQGKPVGALVYESAARALPNWTEDTPVQILTGGEIPPTVAAGQADAYPIELYEREPRDTVEHEMLAIRGETDDVKWSYIIDRRKRLFDEKHRGVRRG
ncbi:hypothetical protein [Amycolatopsis sp. CFH S0078]|uniref:hypothetical protein n=1 Tax=Amycolatopsis sp. CFH S0078 TaxID=1644108 RepID=UPI00106EF129|nr:hypothetical protein [Amycolatopsis sp. CFH S0078]